MHVFLLAFMTTIIAKADGGILKKVTSEYIIACGELAGSHKTIQHNENTIIYPGLFYYSFVNFFGIADDNQAGWWLIKLTAQPAGWDAF